MAITKLKPVPDLEAFIKGAPDAKAMPVSGTSMTSSPATKSKRVQVTVTLTPELLEQVDDASAKMGLTRAATISTALYEYLQNRGLKS